MAPRIPLFEPLVVITIIVVLLAQLTPALDISVSRFDDVTYQNDERKTCIAFDVGDEGAWPSKRSRAPRNRADFLV